MKLTIDKIYAEIVVLATYCATANIEYLSSTECANRFKNILETIKQYKSIEKDLGIDLITFFKIFEGQDVYIKLNNGEIIEGFSPFIEENLCGIYFTVDGKYTNTIADYGSYYVNLKDYGKTWALTREGFENE